MFYCRNEELRKLNKRYVYFPTGENHLHGLSEPVSRRMRTTLTETVPLNLISNNC